MTENNQPSFARQIVFVSAQNAPNFLGARIFGGQTLHALVSPVMRQQGSRLADCWREYGEFRAHPLPESGREAIHRALDAILAACGDEPPALNLTCGTKLMALAAQQWGLAHNVPMFYVDTEARRIVLPGSAWEEIPLSDILDCGALLGLYGFAIAGSSTAAPSRMAAHAARQMANLAASPEGRLAIGRLNECATRAPASPLVALNGKISPAFEKLLAICRDAGMLTLSRNNLRFTSETARKWCNGVWLENCIHSILADIHASGEIRSFHTSAIVRNAGVNNEIDAMFSRGNRLFTIECKTSNIHNKAAPFFYKAHVLKDTLGGIFARAMLCSVDEPGPSDRERADFLKLKVVCGKDLQNLKTHILEWSK